MNLLFVFFFVDRLVRLRDRAPPQAKYPETCKASGVGPGITELVAGMKLKLEDDAEAQDEGWRAQDCRHAWRLAEFYVEATDKVGWAHRQVHLRMD